jgi:hypothetical protein
MYYPGKKVAGTLRVPWRRANGTRSVPATFKQRHAERACYFSARRIRTFPPETHVPLISRRSSGHTIATGSDEKPEATRKTLASRVAVTTAGVDFFVLT